MELLLIALGILYLCVGVVYAFYALIFTYDDWVWFPINVVAGPITLLYLMYVTFFNKNPA